MKYDTFLYEIGILLLVITSVYMGVVLYKLTSIIKSEKKLWLMPLFASLALFLALISHAYANFFLLPEFTRNIHFMTAGDVIKNPEQLTVLKNVIDGIKTQLVRLKAFSFTCFFLASLLLSLATAKYMKLISK